MNIAAARGTNETVKEEAAIDLKLYPNPTTGIFNVTTPIAGTLSVYTIDGKELLQQKIASGVSSLSLPNNIPAGFYTCMFMGTDGGVTIIRLVYEPR
jgi:putative aminopeptidase FrvX